MKRITIIVLLTASLVLSACTLPDKNAAQAIGDDTVRVWMDSPLPDSVFPAARPDCAIVAHGASAAGIALFELSINDEVTVIPSDDTKASLATLTRECRLTVPATYELKVRAQDNVGKWSGYAGIRLIVSEDVTATVVPEIIGLPATARPAGEAAGSVSIASVSLDHVYAGEDTCGPREVTIVARATAVKGIEVPVLFYRFEPGSPPREYENAAMKPLGNDLYQAVLNMRAILGRSIPFARARLQYQVVVQQKDGDTSLRTPVLADIVVEACGNAGLACSGYNNQPVCESHGCNWLMVPGVVSIFKCQSP